MNGGTDMTTQSIAAIFSRARSPFRFLRALRQMSDTVHSRQALRRLDDHLLRDIGLTRHEAEKEASRAPWDVPSHWRN
jgi:uncharacterized protein YjiS (DUF1127 family)